MESIHGASLVAFVKSLSSATFLMKNRQCRRDARDVAESPEVSPISIWQSSARAQGVARDFAAHRVAIFQRGEETDRRNPASKVDSARTERE
jgi:hypothetical protein